ncbi:MAG: hypothetical protein NZ888_01625 [Candidatus Nitrosocaldus sp.]|nr:hypothetical protein [Candidatus Nitrosocaldus sp.]MDW7999798.1 hypothetical protein [Candidatus Nitrosocaldus sp.]
MSLLVEDRSSSSSSSRSRYRMDPRLEELLSRFEHDAEPYDRLAAYSLLLIPIGAVAVALMLLLTGPVTIGWKVYLAVASMIALPFVTYTISIYAERKKHEISESRYRPVTGMCMCDLSQLRYHMIRFEKADNYAEKARHARMMEYYAERIGLGLNGCLISTR